MDRSKLQPIQKVLESDDSETEARGAVGRKAKTEKGKKRSIAVEAEASVADQEMLQKAIIPRFDITPTKLKLMQYGESTFVPFVKQVGGLLPLLSFIIAFAYCNITVKTDLDIVLCVCVCFTGYNNF
jgi:hypothetical protein